jgi:nitroimidazol reductase NimA-like FMN-containing flavoprotein (pyridoxamine 5'-phosphate oxidase superfamily)
LPRNSLGRTDLTDLSPERIDSHLANARIPLRLACVDPSGHPFVLSLWYAWLDGALWCATGPNARVARALAREPRCGFEVAGDTPPYLGVRGQGRAHLHPARGAEILDLLVDRHLATRDSKFARWLLARGPAEVAIRIDPGRLSSWDFAERMR